MNARSDADKSHAPARGLLVVDAGRRIVLVDDAAQQALGRTAADVLGTPLTDHLPATAGCAAGLGECRTAGPLVLARADGHRCDVEVRVTRCTAAIGGALQVCEVWQFEESLHPRAGAPDAMRPYFQAVFERSPQPVWITEGDRLVFLNPACVRLFGATDRTELLGHSIYSLLAPESHTTVRREVARSLAGEVDTPPVHERIARLDGSVRDVEIAVAALPDHGRTTVQMVVTDITQRKKDAQALERSRQELRRLTAALTDAREAERRRIARELHDELGQRLSALKMKLATLRSTASDDEQVDAMLEMVDETVASVRRIASDLRPLMLDDLGLTAAVEWLGREAARRTGLAVTMQLDEVNGLDDATTTALYRFVQEALTNVTRHANASAVNIEMHQSDTEVQVRVCDDGRGFPDGHCARDDAFGLLGLRERAHILSGQLDISNPPHGGGCIRLSVPLRGRCQDETSIEDTTT